MPLRDMPREHAWLLPPSLDELLPLDHPARFVAKFVDALDREDWRELDVEIEGDPLGAPTYHPRALLSIWFYGFVTGIRSSHKLEAACRDQIPQSVANRLATPGPQHSVAVLKASLPGNESFPQASGANGSGDGVGGLGGTGGGRDQGICQHIV